MQKRLTDLQPILEQSKKDTEEMIAKVNVESEAAEKIRHEVAEEEAIASKAATEAKLIQDDCETQLAKALPALDAAMKALKTLTKADLTQVKSFANPPGPVKLTLECICIYLDVKPDKKNDGTGKKILVFFAVFLYIFCFISQFCHCNV